MDKNWRPPKPEKKIELTLDGFIMHLPSDDQRYKDYQELLGKISGLEAACESLQESVYALQAT